MFVETNEDPVRWLEQYGDYLYAFALSRLHNETAAEDVVQETLLSAWQAKEKFSGKSSERTWLTAILKHKIIDYYRRASRQFFSAADDAEFFDESGNWRDLPGDWQATPEMLFEHKEFQAILQSSLARLPANAAAVFTLSQLEGLESREICDILNLSPGNFWVLLHRARLHLRRAIENHWFGIKRRPPMLKQTGELVFSN